MSELELCRLELRSAVGGVVAALAGHVHERIGVVDASLRLDGAGFLIVLNLVRVDLAITLLYIHVASDGRVTVHSDGRLIAGDRDRGVLAVLECISQGNFWRGCACRGSRRGLRRGTRRRVLREQREARGTRRRIVGAGYGRDAAEGQKGDQQ